MGYIQKVKCPGRIGPTENDLSEDTLYYRNLTVKFAMGSNFTECARFYRSYIQSAISVVESYINLHFFYLKQKNNGKLPKKLQNIKSIDDKVDAFLCQFSNTRLYKIRDTQEWIQFNDLRAERNKQVHRDEPYICLSIEDMPRHLNAVISGVGELLCRFQYTTHRDTMGFIERLRTAPKISYNKRQGGMSFTPTPENPDPRIIIVAERE
jgi:hypothetical protein